RRCVKSSRSGGREGAPPPIPSRVSQPSALRLCRPGEAPPLTGSPPFSPKGKGCWCNRIPRRSVLQRSMSKIGELLKPIALQLKKEVVASDVIFTDDTPVTIAQDSNDKSRKGRVWIYLDREGRHFYDFTGTRERAGPDRLLGDYKGFIHADAYRGYDLLFLPGGAVEVACWAHARRKFIEIESSFPELSKQAVDLIRKLY